MIALELASGVGLLVVAAALFSPYWLPPLLDEMRLAASDVNEFRASVPGRRRKAKAHWLGTKDEQRKVAELAALCIFGVGWCVLATHSAVPLPDASTLFKALFCIIAFGAFMSGLGAALLAWFIWVWVWEGFWGRAPSLPAANPMNRVGTASPLGEAKFAAAEEADTALASRGGDFTPPKFRD